MKISNYTLSSTPWDFLRAIRILCFFLNLDTRVRRSPEHMHFLLAMHRRCLSRTRVHPLLLPCLRERNGMPGSMAAKDSTPVHVDLVLGGRRNAKNHIPLPVVEKHLEVILQRWKCIHTRLGSNAFGYGCDVYTLKKRTSMVEQYFPPPPHSYGIRFVRTVRRHAVGI